MSARERKVEEVSHSSPEDRTDRVRLTIVNQRDRLLALVRRRAGPGVDAEEVVQVASERALARVDQLRNLERVEAWVSRIACNAAIDELRRRNSALVELDEAELAEQREKDVVDCWCVLAQVGSLKTEYATILRRVVIDGARVTDVAVELGLSANNATVRLHRAREALRKQMQKHCGTIDVRSCSECGCAERQCCA